MFKIAYWKIALSLIVVFMTIILSAPTFLEPNSILAKFLPSQRVNLGLDLRGGASILLEMELDSYEKGLTEKFIEHIKIAARAEKLPFQVLVNNANLITLKSDELASHQKLVDLVKKSARDVYHISTEGGQNNIILRKNEEALSAQRDQIFNQTIEIIRRRVDETGTKEIDLQRQGDNYILLQIPGIENPGEIKNLLGKTAKLGFHLVKGGQSTGEYVAGTKFLPYVDSGHNGEQIARNIAVQSTPLLTGEMLSDAQTSLYNSTPVVTFKLNTIGSKIFAEASTKYIGSAFAIVLDNVIISAPVIREPILNGNGQISGNFTIASANELALLLRAGALPVPLKIVEERSVGPSLGLDSIKAGTNSALLGISMVLVFMFIFYYWFGMIANVALVLNLFMIIAVLSLFNATLTMPGIAGIVLTLGMAVDANVLIFERIREELSKGRTALAAIESGYKLAFNTIFDSNITTVLVGVILYMFGVGPIKGFAVTLIIGILCSMFTAVTITKIIISIWFRKYKPKVITI